MKILYSLAGAVAVAAVLFGAPSAGRLVGATAAPKASAAPSSLAATKTSPDKAEAAGAAEAAELARANAIFKDLQTKYRYLDGVTIVVGTTPDNKEAVSYYTEDEILISRTHTVELQKILAHESWHIIDWRDNGRLDWGEDLPPSNASDYQL